MPDLTRAATISPPTDAAGRRLRGSVRPLVIDAAREEFAQRGYAGATTKEIARRAGVAESLLFRYFQSKANLFETAVIEPFNAFIEEHVANWVVREGHAPETPAEEFVRGIFRLFDDKRELAFAILAAHQHETDVDTDVEQVGRLLEQLTTIVAHESEMRGWIGVNPEIATRNIVGMITAAAMLKDWFYAGIQNADDETIIKTLVQLIVNGLAGQPTTEVRAELVDEPSASRAVVRGRTSNAALDTANEWITANRGRLRVTDLGWHELDNEEIELRIYYSLRAGSAAPA